MPFVMVRTKIFTIANDSRRLQERFDDLAGDWGEWFDGDDFIRIVSTHVNTIQDEGVITYIFTAVIEYAIDSDDTVYRPVIPVLPE